MSKSEVAQLGVLAVTQGHWGERMVSNIARRCPCHWAVQHWTAPRVLPPTIDDPLDSLPPILPQADLLLVLSETPGLAQLIPEITKMSGTRAVIAPVDRPENLPPGLQRQIKGWLDEFNVAVVFPMPFCSLTPTTYNCPPIVMEYADPLIVEFARYFGRPLLRLTIDAERRVAKAEVVRDTACGCAAHVAETLRGIAIKLAEHEAGMLHHHYPCLAGMNTDTPYHDTLMHVSGHLLREAVRTQIKDRLDPEPYFTPLGKAE